MTRLLSLTFAFSAVVLGGCGTKIDDDSDGASLPSRADLLAAPPGSPEELLQRARANASLDDDAVRDLSRQHRDARERARLLAAAGPPIELRGRVVSALDAKPESDCHVSHMGQEAYTDANGDFILYAIPSDGQIRLRLRCHGLVERHNLVVPAVDALYELPEVIEVGRRLRPSTAENDDLDAAPHPAIASVFDGAVSDLTPSAPRVAPSAPVVGGHAGGTATPSPSVAGRANASAIETTIQNHATAPASASSSAPTTPRIQVHAEQIVDGSLSAQDIAPELRRRAAALHACYAEHLEAHRDDTEAVRVRFVISPTGNPEAVEILGSTFDLPDQDQCVVRRITRLSFPASDGTTKVTQTFIFGFRLVPDAQIQ